MLAGQDMTAKVLFAGSRDDNFQNNPRLNLVFLPLFTPDMDTLPDSPINMANLKAYFFNSNPLFHSTHDYASPPSPPHLL